MMPTTVMIIAPLAPLRAALESLLSAAGYSVIRGAANVIQVRLFLNASMNPPDIAIIDMRLPQKKIAGLVQTLKSRHVAVLLMGVDNKGEEFAEEIGVPFLSKPFTKEDLLTTIEKARKKRSKSRRG